MLLWAFRRFSSANVSLTAVEQIDKTARSQNLFAFG
jgi:hypothetical protein